MLWHREQEILSKMGKRETKELKPITIENVAEYLQKLLESNEINDTGAVKVMIWKYFSCLFNAIHGNTIQFEWLLPFQIIPPKAIKLSPMNEKSVLPKIDRQTVIDLKMDSSSSKPALFQMKYEKLIPMELIEFKEIAVRTSSTTNEKIEDTIESMWDSLCNRAKSKPKFSPIYATEWAESMTQDGDQWKINNFTEKHSILNVNPVEDKILGVQSSFAIVGMWDTWFCAHQEDSDIASINEHLHGAPKVWYVIARKDAGRFQKLFYDLLHGEFEYDCSTALRHKCFIIPPWILDIHGIDYKQQLKYFCVFSFLSFEMVSLAYQSSPICLKLKPYPIPKAYSTKHTHAYDSDIDSICSLRLQVNKNTKPLKHIHTISFMEKS